MRKSEYPWDFDGDLHKESAKHKQLLDAIDTLKEQIPLLREKIRNAKAELLRTVKRFERLKTDLISTLRSKEWRLDSESKLFVRVNDQKTYLQNELLICQNNIMRLQRNGSYWKNIPRKNDERVMDPKRGPVKKIFCVERLPPIAT
ncbi:unnamed protein product [Leptidea sinapis]|uniref:Uncharacterized protein n=1 Tax=Leptidea sinapis TaxID=189913 RepID=A0A5E4R233_9NEOP|nr:unnamed protein product [Leptidea sinapis]